MENKYLIEVTFASDGQEIQINVLRISGDNFKELELIDVTFFSNDNLNFITNLDEINLMAIRRNKN